MKANPFWIMQRAKRLSHLRRTPLPTVRRVGGMQLPPLGEIPVWLVSLVGVIAAALFTFGYFSNISIIFLTAFTFQEHLVFAIGGLYTVSILGFIAVITGICLDIVIRTLAKRSKYVVPVIEMSAFVTFLVLVVLFWVIHDNERNYVVASTVGVIAFAVIGFAVPQLLRGSPASRYAIVVAVPFASFGAGLFDSALQFRHPPYRPSIVMAQTSAGERLRVLRIGHERSIVQTLAGDLELVLTSDLLRIHTVDCREPRVLSKEDGVACGYGHP